MIPARISKYRLQLFPNLLNAFNARHPSVFPFHDNLLLTNQDCIQLNLAGTGSISAAPYACIAKYSCLNLNALTDYL
jgi:hypothetical protein